MSKVHPTLRVYDKQANYYDIMNSPMERFFSKGRKVFSLLRGNILELGVGTGLNLSYYHPSTNVTALDWSSQMVNQARAKVRRLRLHHIKKIVVGDIMELDKHFKPHTFDFVTSTCVFCSVPDPIKGLQEIAKILKPSGFLVQIEHGLSNFRIINFFMKFFDPFIVKWRGFHITRNTLKNLKIAGFETIHQWSLDPTGIIRVIISKLDS